MLGHKQLPSSTTTTPHKKAPPSPAPSPSKSSRSSTAAAPAAASGPASSHSISRRHASASTQLLLPPQAATALAAPAPAPAEPAAETPNLQLPPAPDSIVELTPSTYQDFIAKEGEDSLVLIDFYTDWCGPCRLMDSHLHHLTFAFKGVKFAKFNCGVHEEFSSGLRIRSLPTFRLYHKRKCLEQLTGAQPVKLRQLLVHYFRPKRSKK